MPRVWWTALLWPGLPYILSGASFRALGVSIAAAAALNLLLAATFLWDELLDRQVRNIGWCALAVVWAAAALLFVIQQLRSQTRIVGGASARFPAAIEHYLRGEWYETERLLKIILKSNPEDVEARLLLATLFRHTRRRDEARLELQTLATLRGAGVWQWEIQRELALLTQASQSSADGSSEPGGVKSDSPEVRGATATAGDATAGDAAAPKQAGSPPPQHNRCKLPERRQPVQAVE